MYCRPFPSPFSPSTSSPPSTYPPSPPPLRLPSPTPFPQFISSLISPISHENTFHDNHNSHHSSLFPLLSFSPSFSHPPLPLQRHHSDPISLSHRDFPNSPTQSVYHPQKQNHYSENVAMGNNDSMSGGSVTDGPLSMSISPVPSPLSSPSHQHREGNRKNYHFRSSSESQIDHNENNIFMEKKFNYPNDYQDHNGNPIQYPSPHPHPSSLPLELLPLLSPSISTATCSSSLSSSSPSLFSTSFTHSYHRERDDNHHDHNHRSAHENENDLQNHSVPPHPRHNNHYNNLHHHDDINHCKMNLNDRYDMNDHTVQNENMYIHSDHRDSSDSHSHDPFLHSSSHSHFPTDYSSTVFPLPTLIHYENIHDEHMNVHIRHSLSQPHSHHSIDIFPPKSPSHHDGLADSLHSIHPFHPSVTVCNTIPLPLPSSLSSSCSSVSLSPHLGSANPFSSASPPSSVTFPKEFQYIRHHSHPGDHGLLPPNHHIEVSSIPSLSLLGSSNEKMRNENVSEVGNPKKKVDKKREKEKEKNKGREKITEKERDKKMKDENEKHGEREKRRKVLLPLDITMKSASLPSSSSASSASFPHPYTLSSDDPFHPMSIHHHVHHPLSPSTSHLLPMFLPPSPTQTYSPLSNNDFSLSTTTSPSSSPCLSSLSPTLSPSISHCPPLSLDSSLSPSSPSSSPSSSSSLPVSHCPWANCSKGFTKPSALKRHLRVHTKERPFLCTFPGCTLGFSERGNLKRHLKLHLEEKKFRCLFHPQCSLWFTRRNQLISHLRTEHDGSIELRRGEDEGGGKWMQVVGVNVNQRIREEGENERSNVEGKISKK